VSDDPYYGNQTTVAPPRQSKEAEQDPVQAGLLVCYPLGEPPAFTYRILQTGGLVVGRSPSCSMRLADQQMSRTHARFELSAGGRCRLSDLGSANGTFVNGQRCQEALLQGDELVRLGGTLLRFRPTGKGPRQARYLPARDGMIAGPSMLPTLELIERGASSDLSFLIRGETGTGKELVARALHEAGRWKQGPFVPVNCAAIPRDLVESELFGHVRGAFSGATQDKRGLIAEANGGTLFLDELGELPKESQAKLLRVLQERTLRPVGATRSQPVELHVVSATNRDLHAMIDADSFRADLFARLAEVELLLPALRERFEDIPLLLGHFLEKHGAASVSRTELDAELIEALCLRSWPFNIRELESAVRKALLLAGDEPLALQHFAKTGGDLRTLGPAIVPRDTEATNAFGTDPTEPAVTLRSVRGTPANAAAMAPASADSDPEVKQLIEALERFCGDTAAAAKALGISRSQLYRRAKSAGIVTAHFKKA
jgi:DNA-binding NtrC family response regulator